MQRFRMLDLLRALAAALVVLTHVAFWTGADHLDVSGPLLARGDAGVAVFFAISAFLLLRPFLRAGLTGGSTPDLRRYAVRRAARILPAYWVALAAVLLVAALAPVRTGGVGSPLDVVLHVLVLQGCSGHTYQSFSQTWSLTTEVTFYVLVPVIGTVLGRLARRPRRVWPVLGATLLAGLCAQGASAAWTGVDPHSGAGVLATSVLGHAGWFAAGAALAVLTETGPSALASPVRRWLDFARTNPGVVALGAALLFLLAATPLAGPVDLHAPTPAQAVVKELLYTGIAALLVLAATSPVRGTVARAVAGSPAARWLGDASYPVFLWHVLALQVVYLVTSRALFTGAFTTTLVAVTALTIVVARVSVGLVERPVLAQAHRRTRSAPRQDTAPAGTP
ncbi:acyltransferase [Allobranchiibius sp. GilTou73]|uniref:acyltransferase family protein n=1 Tax=Allobranchiibius sp. GilTou73 TaxID=2904523 RepID=UPI001F2545E6|nr:acyltransferase [Allobranchiibius sp. GilTou73]UIJ33831.1 acyltransferase [Allobranchiibius sp. GilTou73]